MLLCEYCQLEAKKQGKKIVVYEQKYTADESIDKDIPCDECDEYDNLWLVKFN